MKESGNIEKLFKDTFEHFEADVNPQVWTNVQGGMNAASGSAASAAAKFAIGKIVAGVAAVALVSAGIWYAASKEKVADSPVVVSEKQQTSETISSEIPAATPVAGTLPAPIKTHPAAAGVTQNAPPAIRTLNHYSSDNSVQQTRIAPVAGDNAVYSDVAALEHAAASSPAHKYGNATQGDGGMIRGTQLTGSSPAQGKSAVNPEEPDADAPTAAIFANTFSGDAPLTVDFMNQSAASSLSWDFGDGNTSRESAPSHTFEKPGIYTVKLTTKNSSRSATDKVIIEVKTTSSIDNIPNIFTPNGDGENDLFLFDIKNISSIGVAIISHRTGEVITQWNNLDGNWNGKLRNGADAPAGVYLYSIQAIGTDGVTHSEKGFVTINR